MQLNDDMVDAALDAHHAASLAISSDPFEAMRAALEAALAHMWRPIEEAPKDNSAVLLYVPMKTINFVTTAFWDTVAQEWRVAWTGIQNTPSKVEGAIHFMPLPSRPAVAQRPEGQE